MLNAVPTAIRTAARNVMLRHPNAMPCQVWRREVDRTFAAQGGVDGNQVTIGGIGTMNGEDEPEIDFKPIGEARILISGVRQPEKLSYTRDVPEAEFQTAIEAQIEPLVLDAFTCKHGDLVMVEPGGGVVVTYSVNEALTNIHIPPYVVKYELIAQGDDMFIPGVAAAVAAR